ncbi:MAG: MFS transporter, partial [Treponema sp.]|nr:MFS transporter [Treponema sp.]
MTEKQRNPVLGRLGYGCGDIFGGGGFLICNLLIFNFLVIVEGLSVVQASTIIFICKLWDGVTDPVMGFISDRTRTRFGRRRIYFLAGAPLV